MGLICTPATKSSDLRRPSTKEASHSQEASSSFRDRLSNLNIRNNKLIVTLCLWSIPISKPRLNHQSHIPRGVNQDLPLLNFTRTLQTSILTVRARRWKCRRRARSQSQAMNCWGRRRHGKWERARSIPKRYQKWPNKKCGLTTIQRRTTLVHCLRECRPGIFWRRRSRCLGHPRLSSLTRKVLNNQLSLIRSITKVRRLYFVQKIPKAVIKWSILSQILSFHSSSWTRDTRAN